MNSKGQVWGYTLSLGIVILILALALAPAGQTVINQAMNTTVGDTIGLDCNNVSINLFDKGTCTIADYSSAYFFGALIFIAFAVITAKLSFGGTK